MARGRKRDKFKKWLSGLFFSAGDSDGRQRHTGLGGFFSRARNFTLHGATMTVVHGDLQLHTTPWQAAPGDVVAQNAINLLTQHMIRGAAHDSSARSPPPSCHPDTRVQLIAGITAWFKGEGALELLLWITGPAGVGKSAIVQTFAEYLVKIQSLGASVFISRPNKRNNPHGIFITVAYQLASRIDAYRAFIVERLRVDPVLLSGNMQAQFATLIVEPFVQKKIGAGGKRWGILLDGLDELSGEEAQCDIIRLISDFVRQHPETPLVWIIASRSESHICNTFDDEAIRRSCWMEHIPIDSTEACEDVERFLRSSFTKIQKRFQHSVPDHWPSDTDFLDLLKASSGLFVYAQVVVDFIKDSRYDDPISQFEALLAVISRSDVVPTEDNPFVHLDALYAEILSSIPPKLWPTAKQLLAYTLHVEDVCDIVFTDVQPKERQLLQSLRGTSILFGIRQSTIYACLNRCRSTLRIPDWKVAQKQNLTFLHASFADYLRDSGRSGDFHVGDAKDVEECVVSSLLEIWNKCSGDDVATASVESRWLRYCSELDSKTPSRDIAKLHAKIFPALVDFVRGMTHELYKTPVESFRYAPLCKVNMVKLCYYFDARHLLEFVIHLTAFSLQFKDVGIFRQIQLGDLNFGHFDLDRMSPVYAHYGKSGQISAGADLKLHRPRSTAELDAFVSELQPLQARSPELEVFVFGGLPNGRIAAFRRPLREQSVYQHDFMYYTIPYPE